MLVLLVFAGFSLQPISVIGGSMSPTLRNGDVLLSLHLGYRPQRGDVVLVRDPTDPQQDLVKRVIAGPGDTVIIRSGAVYLNGRRLSEPYVKTPWLVTRNWPDVPDSPQGELVPPDNWFLLGDNRDNSSDSRLYGWFRTDQILGHAVLRVWPAPSVGFV